MRKKRTRVLECSIAAALAGVAGGAFASGFQLLEQNASGLGNAYAGQAASAQDASTIFFNPAGMTLLPGKNAVGAMNVIRPSARFTDAGSPPAILQPAAARGGNGGDAGDLALVPNMYRSWQLTPQWFVGIGVNAPFGLKTEYDPTWIGRFHAVESDLMTINVNPSVAFKVNDVVSLGAGINFQRAKATLSNAVNYSAAAGGLLGAGLEGLATVEGDDNAWGFNLGAMFTLNPNTRVGVSYRSSMGYKIEGTATFANRPAALAAAIPDGPVTADVRLPAIASIAVRHMLNPQWEILADASWTQWNTVQTLNIVRSTNGVLLTSTPLNWKDTWRVGVGANYHYNSAWTLRFGAAYDQSPVPDLERTPRIPDQDRTWLAIGAQYRWSKQLAIDFGYAHLFVRSASSNLCAPGQPDTANPRVCGGKNNLIGSYNAKVDILSAQMRYAF